MWFARRSRARRFTGQVCGRLGIISSLTVLALAAAPVASIAQEALPATSDNPDTAANAPGQPIDGGGDSIQSIGGGGGTTTTTSTSELAPVPPEKFLRSPGGVDMRTGELLYTHTDLSIGGDKGLQLIRHFSPVSAGLFTPGTMGGFSHNWDIRISEKKISVPGMTDPVKQKDYQVVVAGPRSKTYRARFSPEQGDFFSFSAGLYSWLSFDFVMSGSYLIPTRYTYGDTEGTQISFRTTGSAAGPADGCAAVKCAFAQQMSDADGTTYTLSYDLTGSSTVPRLRAVRNNRGYALLFEYAPGTTSPVKKACALNLAYTIMPAISGDVICPVGVPTSTYTYNSSGLLVGFTDQAGVYTNIGADGSALYWPGEATPYVTNTIVKGVRDAHVTAQSFADGRSFTYAWDYDGNSPIQMIAGGSYTDNNGKTVAVRYGKYRPFSYDPTYLVTENPETTTDEINRTWSYYYGCSGTAYCGPKTMQSKTLPDLNKVQYSYDLYGNVTENRRIAKPGTGLADIVETAAFNCVGAIMNCNKPISMTDANSHTTNYTYDPTHGGLLTQMGPAPVASGARPLTVNTYAQRYAWTKNSSGVLVQETVPVWVLSTSTMCQTVAGANPSPVCDGTAPQTMTTYQYGATGGAEALLVKGVAVASGGTTLRTCYSYDQYSRKISETKPNANLSVCP
jgi:hypothetical protein